MCGPSSRPLFVTSSDFSEIYNLSTRLSLRKDDLARALISRTTLASISCIQGVCTTCQVATAVNAEIASLHATPLAETVARRQQGWVEMSPMRPPSPAGYQDMVRRKLRRLEKPMVSGEESSSRRHRLFITVSGKWRRRHSRGGSGRTCSQTLLREGPEPVSTCRSRCGRECVESAPVVPTHTQPTNL